MHWRTTLGGLLMAIGSTVSLANGTLPSWVHLIGHCMEIAGPIVLGVAASDKAVQTIINSQNAKPSDSETKLG